MRKILVVRKFDNFSRLLQKSGFEVVNCPTIETVTNQDLSDFEAKISSGKYDVVFLTSPKSAEIFSAKVSSFKGKIYVFGKKGFEKLKEKLSENPKTQFEPELYFDESANTVEEMLKKIPPDSLKHKKCLFVKGDKSLGVVKDFLKGITEVDETVVYTTKKISVDEQTKTLILHDLSTGRIRCACFFSPSGVEGFIENFGFTSLKHTKISAFGQTTADFLRQNGFQVDFVPSKTRLEDFALEIKNFLEKIETRELK